MCAPVMIVAEVLGQEPPQMSLMQDDHVVQAFAADAPNQPFDVWILPRTPRGDDHLFDLHVLHPLPKRSAVDVVPIPQEIPWRLMPRKGFHNLLCGPRGGGMFGDMNVDDPSSLVGQNYEDKEYFVGDRRHDKEIQGHEVLHVGL